MVGGRTGTLFVPFSRRLTGRPLTAVTHRGRRSTPSRRPVGRARTSAEGAAVHFMRASGRRPPFDGGRDSPHRAARSVGESTPRGRAAWPSGTETRPQQAHAKWGRRSRLGPPGLCHRQAVPPRRPSATPGRPRSRRVGGGAAVDRASAHRPGHFLGDLQFPAQLLSRSGSKSAKASRSAIGTNVGRRGRRGGPGAGLRRRSRGAGPSGSPRWCQFRRWVRRAVGEAAAHGRRVVHRRSSTLPTSASAPRRRGPRGPSAWAGRERAASASGSSTSPRAPPGVLPVARRCRWRRRARRTSSGRRRADRHGAPGRSVGAGGAHSPAWGRTAGSARPPRRRLVVVAEAVSSGRST